MFLELFVVFFCASFLVTWFQYTRSPKSVWLKTILVLTNFLMGLMLVLEFYFPQPEYINRDLLAMTNAAILVLFAIQGGWALFRAQ